MRTKMDLSGVAFEVVGVAVAERNPAQIQARELPGHRRRGTLLGL
jgi:hypothetical protein